MSSRVLFVTLHVAMNHRRCIAWCHSTTKVISATWLGANSRPYMRNTFAPIVYATFYAAPRPSSGSPRRASFPRGKLLFRIGWAPFESNGDIPGRFPERQRPFPTVSLVGGFFHPHRLYPLYSKAPRSFAASRGFYYRGMRIVASGFVWAAVFSQLSTSGFSSS